MPLITRLSSSDAPQVLYDLIVAIKSHDDDQGASLIENDAFPVGDVDGFDRTALHWAAEHGCVGLVERLLTKGASWNVWDGFGFAPLHSAVVNDQASVVRALLAAGAGMETSTRSPSQSMTPLVLAVHYRRSATVNVLLEQGAVLAWNDGRPSVLDMARRSTVPGCTILEHISAEWVRREAQRLRNETNAGCCEHDAVRRL